ncbi:MAG TPA: hypothetical protein VNV82_23230 [Bryobacteraceae bacterium]|jgi:transposase-like protein|nr:hypothetical protein [Bryobacteraceae bacterium]
MTCHSCRTQCQKHGKDRKGHQRYKCQQCSKTFLEPREKPLDGMYLPMEKAETILKMLVEGISIRSIERLTNVHRDTILRVLVKAGEHCEKLMSEKIVNVPCRDVELDEIWGWVFCKERANRPEHDPSFGDNYCFVAIERNTKLVLNFALENATKRPRISLSKDCGTQQPRSRSSSLLMDSGATPARLRIH